MKASITIKELHAQTGLLVRRASRSPVQVTDRGRLVAVLAGPQLVLQRHRRRILLPEYAALWAAGTKGSLQADLDAVRGER